MQKNSRKIISVELGLVLLISSSYLVLFHFLTGLRSEHLVICIFCLSAYLLHPNGRKLILGFVAFLVYWILWDGMKAFPNYLYHDVSIEGIYTLEKNWFGLNSPEGIMTPGECMMRYTAPWKDLLSAFCYFSWVPIPLLFGFYLFYKKSEELILYSFCFLMSNLLGFALYYLAPAAPPWYVALHGFTLYPQTPGYAAGLLKADALLGIQLFEGMYQKSSNVFAAFPSLHAAYPLVAFLYAIKNRYFKWSIGLLCLCLGIWWSAIYTQHHYLIDVLAGICCGVAGYLLMELIYQYSQKLQTAVAKYAETIRPI